MLYFIHYKLKINQQPYFVHSFAQKTTCSDISQNEQCIAVSLETGKISVSIFVHMVMRNYAIDLAVAIRRQFIQIKDEK